MKHLKLYRAIRLIHRTGSIRKAAADLSISPSALNRSIQAFEAELAFDVFDRQPGGVRLSEAGELLMDVIDRHLIEFSELQAQLGSLRDGDVGALRLSLGSDIAAGVVLDCVAEIEARFPGLGVDVSLDDTTERLLRRDVHLAVLSNPATDDATEVIYAHPCTIAVYQRAAQATALGGVWDLTSARVVLPPEGTGTRASISHALRRSRIALAQVTTMAAPGVLGHLAQSDAIAIFPDIAFGAQANGAAWSRLDLGLGQIQICALRRAGMPMTRPAQAFLTALQRRLEERDSAASDTGG